MKQWPVRPLAIAMAVSLLVGCSDDDEPTRSNGDTSSLPVTLIAADRNGDIYSVDPATGQETFLLDTTPAVPRGGADIGVVSAMLHVPQTGALWAGTGGNATCNGCILTIDPDTGVATELFDNSDETNGIPGLTIRPSDGRIFMGEGDSSGFYELDATTGDATRIGDNIASSSGKGITFSADETLYLAADETLYSVDPDAAPPTDAEIGDFTLTGFPAFAGGFSIGAMTTRPSDGAIFAIVKDDGGTGGSGPTYLARVDVATAELTNVGVNGVKLDGLAFVPESLFE
jgi:outer membrane protein assembly factor BamB